MLKRFALPLSITSGIFLYCLFAFLPVLQPTGILLAPLMKTLLPSFMFMILFTVFCKIDFRTMRLRRWHLFGLLTQTAIAALITLVLLSTGIHGDSYILGEAVLAACIGPCAAAAAVVVGKLRGHLEEITTYTFLSNILVAFLIPIIFPLVEKDTEIEFFHAFTTILWHVSIILLVPMLAAYIVKRYIRSLHRLILSIPDFGFYMWCLSIMIVSGTTVRNIVHADTSSSFLLLIALSTLAVCCLQFSIGRGIGHLCSRIPELGQGVGQKNTAFAIWIATTYLHPLSCVGPGCYILWQNSINALLIWKAEKRKTTGEKL